MSTSIKTILLLGSGGREHALAWKMAQSDSVQTIYAIPGSDGIATVNKVQCIAGSTTDAYFVTQTALTHHVDLVVVGPETPLAEGVVDSLEKSGVAVLGPRKTAAQLESSKIFSKKFMMEFGIPTAPFKIADSDEEAVSICTAWDIENEGVVLKADGLAAGKGVVVTHDREETLKTIHDFMINAACTVKTGRLLIEEKISGKEVSAFALCDGNSFIPLGYACDYKRVMDNDEGPNTGGMGGYAPKDWPSAEMRQFINDHVFSRVIAGMQKRGTPFKGILFAGLMINGDDVKVIEFNTRFGDPEAQILLPLIQGDIVSLFAKAAHGELYTEQAPSLSPLHSVHVVMTSEGYPETMGTGMRLGVKMDIPIAPEHTHIFIGGAKKHNDYWVNSGGRVIGVTALGTTLDEARKRAYSIIEQIHFQGAHWRKDIGQ